MARCQAARDNRVMEHLSRERLDAGLDHILDSPRDGGRVILVVRRPEAGIRELPDEGLLDPEAGSPGTTGLPVAARAPRTDRQTRTGRSR
jgi:hypothetical protein